MKKYIIKRKIVIEEEVCFDNYIAFKIENYRKERKLTQEAFADLIGLSLFLLMPFAPIVANIYFKIKENNRLRNK